MPPSIYLDRLRRAGETAEKEVFWDLIVDRSLCLRLLILSYSWLVVTLSYYGLSLTSVSLSGNPYLNFFLVSLVEIPGRSDHNGSLRKGFLSKSHLPKGHSAMDKALAWHTGGRGSNLGHDQGLWCSYPLGYHHHVRSHSLTQCLPSHAPVSILVTGS